MTPKILPSKSQKAMKARRVSILSAKIRMNRHRVSMFWERGLGAQSDESKKKLDTHCVSMFSCFAHETFAMAHQIVQHKKHKHTLCALVLFVQNIRTLYGFVCFTTRPIAQMSPTTNTSKKPQEKQNKKARDTTRNRKKTLENTRTHTSTHM